MKSTLGRFLLVSSVLMLFMAGSVSSQEALSSEKIKAALEQAYEEGRKAGYKEGYAAGLEAARTSGMPVVMASPSITEGQETLDELLNQVARGNLSESELVDRLRENRLRLR